MRSFIKYKRCIIKYIVSYYNIRYIILHDGHSSSIEDINDFILSNNEEDEVVEAIYNLLMTKQDQPVGQGFTIKLYL